jgi:hypothetical protein
MRSNPGVPLDRAILLASKQLVRKPEQRASDLVRFAREYIRSDIEYVAMYMPRPDADVHEETASGVRPGVGARHNFVGRIAEYAHMPDALVRLGPNMGVFVAYAIHGYMSRVVARGDTVNGMRMRPWDFYNRDCPEQALWWMPAQLVVARIGYDIVQPMLDAWYDAAYEAVRTAPDWPSAPQLWLCRDALLLFMRIARDPVDFFVGQRRVSRTTDIATSKRAALAFRCPISGGPVQLYGNTSDCSSVVSVVARELRPEDRALIARMAAAHLVVAVDGNQVTMVVSDDHERCRVPTVRGGIAAVDLCRALLNMRTVHNKLGYGGEKPLRKSVRMTYLQCPQLQRDLYTKKRSRLLEGLGVLVNALHVVQHATGVAMDTAAPITRPERDASALPDTTSYVGPVPLS